MRAIPLTLLLSGWIALPAHAADAQDWLGRLAQAEQKQSFHGTFIYERNGSFSTHEIWHRVAAGDVRERVIQLDGLAQEALRVNGLPQCVSGGSPDGLEQAPSAPIRALDAKKLSAFYDLKVIGGSRVAGRDVVIISLSPRDPHRYGFELSLDEQTALPLKSVMVNSNGQLLERFQYIHLDTSSAVADADLAPGSQCQKVTVTARQPTVTAWRSEWVPDGFTLTDTRSIKVADTDKPVTSLLFDDGLARFSVFIEPLGGAKAQEARSQLGPTAALSRHIASSTGEAMVTVVGEIPMGTAERIALSMRDTPAQPSP